MKTVRRTRRTVRTAGLAAVAAAAMFSLTACQDDIGKDDGAAASPSASSSEDSGSGGTDSENPDSNTSGGNGSNANGSGGNGGAQSGGKGDNAGTQTAGGNSGGDSGVKRSACTVAKTSVEFQETGGSAPVILLKATNRGDDRCDLYGYPLVGYPNAQSPLQAGGGPPQAVISLEPGQSAYASLSLEEGNGADMHREKKLTVELANKNQHGTGATATLTAPGAGLALGDKSTVSYWKTTAELAMQ